MGLNKAIPTPELLYKLFNEYETDIKENPLLVQDFVGKGADEVNRKKIRPLTMVGFENFCFKKGLLADLGPYFANRESRYDDFVSICSRIRKQIQQDQIEGGMAGIYNPSITQRLNGLAEKQETRQVDIEGNDVPNLLEQMILKGANIS